MLAGRDVIWVIDSSSLVDLKIVPYAIRPRVIRHLDTLVAASLSIPAKYSKNSRATLLRERWRVTCRTRRRRDMSPRRVILIA